MRQSPARAVLSRRELLSLGVAGVLSSLQPKSIDAREGDKRPELIYIYARRTSFRTERDADGVFTVDPENDSWQFLIDGFAARVSPDGSTIAYLDTHGPEENPFVLRLLNLETRETKPVGDLNGRPLWSRDGKELIVAGTKRSGIDTPTETWKVNVADPAKKVRLPIAETDEILDLSPDGKTLLVRRKPNNDEPPVSVPKCSLHLVDLDGKDLGRVLAAGVIRSSFRFARDGKRIFYSRYVLDKEISELWSVGVDGKDNRLFLGERENEAPEGPVVWSPDDKRMAVSYIDRPKGPDGKKNSLLRNCHLEIADSNGANSRRVALPEDFNVIFCFDWR